MDIRVRQAVPADSDMVLSILNEAAEWLESRGAGMWRADELDSAETAEAVKRGLFFLAVDGQRPVGTMKCQLSDPLFWPDMPQGDAAYVHRFAVVRAYAGGAVSSALLAWAVRHAQDLGLRFLRLDCEADRPRLRSVYERFGFQHHSDRQVGPYFVARYQLGVFRTQGSPAPMLG